MTGVRDKHRACPGHAQDRTQAHNTQAWKGSQKMAGQTHCVFGKLHDWIATQGEAATGPAHRVQDKPGPAGTPPQRSITKLFRSRTNTAWDMCTSSCSEPKQDLHMPVLWPSMASHMWEPGKGTRGGNAARSDLAKQIGKLA